MKGSFAFIEYSESNEATKGLYLLLQLLKNVMEENLMVHLQLFSTLVTTEEKDLNKEERDLNQEKKEDLVLKEKMYAIIVKKEGIGKKLYYT